MCPISKVQLAALLDISVQPSGEAKKDPGRATGTCCIRKWGRPLTPPAPPRYCIIAKTTNEISNQIALSRACFFLSTICNQLYRKMETRSLMARIRCEDECGKKVATRPTE